MKEKPILFSDKMVKAILAGEKTQTRRLFKLPKTFEWDESEGGEKTGRIVNPRTNWKYSVKDIFHCNVIDCPYGNVGDRLWVRECFSTDFSGCYPLDDVWYRADDDRRTEIERREGTQGIYSKEHDEFVPFKWRPSIFMPRKYSRITLQITSVTVERLTEISEKDAIAEGALFGQVYQKQAAYQFSRIWRDINGDRSWELNPWVWVIKFERVCNPDE